MKLSKLLLTIVGATVLLGALVTSASARNLSTSSQTTTALWRTMNFTGGFENLECEIKLSGSFHTRTITKTVGSLIGYITEATVLWCTRFGMTINRGSLPWHRRYLSFAGTLPRITQISENIVGAEFTIREPIFGITCTVRRAESGTWAGTYEVSSGIITRAAISSSGSRCEGVAGTLSGSETNVTNGAGARITLTLI